MKPQNQFLYSETQIAMMNLEIYKLYGGIRDGEVAGEVEG
jgi:hypothetical protein